MFLPVCVIICRVGLSCLSACWDRPPTGPGTPQDQPPPPQLTPLQQTPPIGAYTPLGAYIPLGADPPDQAPPEHSML